MRPGLARACALAAAVLFSTGGAAIKVAAFSVPQVSMIRSGIAALLLFVWYRRHLTASRRTIGVAIVYAATLLLFVAATKLTTAANAIFLQATAPLYILLLGPWLLREPVTRRDLAYLVSVAAGMLFCFLGRPGATTTAPDPVAGNLLAAFCGFVWALTLVGLRHLDRFAGGASEAAGLTAVVAGNAIACVVALPWAFPLPRAAMGEWTTVVYLGVVQVALAYVFLTTAMRRLPALEVSLLLLLEPVLNPIWTWLVHGERPGAWTVAGGAVILSATGIKGAWDARSRRGSPSRRPAHQQ